jgi:hypothetical protein
MELFSRFIAESRDGSEELLMGGRTNDKPSLHSTAAILTNALTPDVDVEEKVFKLISLQEIMNRTQLDCCEPKSAKQGEAYHGKFIGHDYWFEAQNCLIARKFINLAFGKGSSVTWTSGFGDVGGINNVVGLKVWGVFSNGANVSLLRLKLETNR